MHTSVNHARVGKYSDLYIFFYLFLPLLTKQIKLITQHSEPDKSCSTLYIIKYTAEYHFICGAIFTFKKHNVCFGSGELTRGLTTKENINLVVQIYF